MLIRIGYDMEVTVPAPTPMVLMLHVRPDLVPQLRRADDLSLDPAIPAHTYTDGFGNRCTRIVAPPGTLRLRADGLIENHGQPDEVASNAPQHNIEDLPDETLEFLLGSRYCEVDELSGRAWDLFGNSPRGWGRVQAVCDWVHHHVSFGYQHARPTKTAGDVLKEGTGVCRDFQHLAVTFCRSLGIPARYATGYLGDIGVAPSEAAMDFSAWFQAFLGGRWYDFDARFNTPRIGRTLMAVGRDAADVALMTTFGKHSLDKFVVIGEEFVGEPAPVLQPA